MITLLALPQPGPPAATLASSAAACLQLEHVAERQAEHGRSADAQQIAASQSDSAITIVSAELPWNAQTSRGSLRLRSIRNGVPRNRQSYVSRPYYVAAVMKYSRPQCTRIAIHESNFMRSNARNGLKSAGFVATHVALPAVCQSQAFG